MPNFLFQEDFLIKEYLINDQIRDREVMVIDTQGKSLGVMSIQSALQIAEDVGLDLVKVGQGQTPTCKLMQYDKFRYETEKKEKEAKKNQKIIKIKEVQLSIVIDTNDMRTKAKRANEFIANGDKVKVVIRMKGRQNKRPELGINVMNEFFSMMENAVKEQGPVIEGNTIRMVLALQNKK